VEIIRNSRILARRWHVTKHPIPRLAPRDGGAICTNFGFFLFFWSFNGYCVRVSLARFRMPDRITITLPDDWHLHVRDGEMMRATVGFSAEHFGRAIIMPNLASPIRTTAEARAYRERLLAALPAGNGFEPLMTCYLTDDTEPDDVEAGFVQKVFTAVKLYPANATTNSAAGVTDFKKVSRVLERMQRIGMPLLIHAELVDPDVDIFDREAVFIDRIFEPWTQEYPKLRFVHEHLSSKYACDFVRSKGGQVGGSITPYHLELTRTDWLGSGNRSYLYCMPVLKTAADRAALRKAATGGEPYFFLGTDSAPHSVHKKLAVVGAAGLFNSPVAIETYAKVFEEEGKLANLEAFASLNGPAHYRLAPNSRKLTLERTPWIAPEEVRVPGPEERALIYHGGEKIPWKVIGIS
jgi:dihydroorotase